MNADQNTTLVELLAERLAPVVRAAVEAATTAALAETVGKPPPRLLTVGEVAERLQCCDESVRRFVKAGRLQAVTCLGHLRFRPDGVERFLNDEANTPS